MLARVFTKYSVAKPIDVLAKYVNASESDIEIQEPYQLLRVSM